MESRVRRLKRCQVHDPARGSFYVKVIPSKRAGKRTYVSPAYTSSGGAVVPLRDDAVEFQLIDEDD